MEDPIVTLLDGTRMPKSQVPIDTIYINENGEKVKKVKKLVTKMVAKDATSEKTSISSFLNSGLGATILSAAMPKINSILKNQDLGQLTSALSNTEGGAGMPIKDSAIDLITSLAKGNVDKNKIMSLLSSVDIQQISNLASKFNLPWLIKICDILTKILPANTPIQQFNNYLTLAWEDKEITNDEEQKIMQLGKQAGLTDAQIKKAIKERKK